MSHASSISKTPSTDILAILDYDISVKAVADLVKIIQYIEQQVEHQAWFNWF